MGNRIQSEPHLTKTRYVQGLQCSKRLWLAWYDPEPSTDPAPGSPMAVGLEVGMAGRNLIPGGVVVKEPAYHHAEAVERTKVLLADSTVPAIFEAAFEFDQLRIRVDILERLPGGWRLCEAKSSTKTKPEHLDELAVQWHVITACRIDLIDAQLIHINNTYVRGDGEIDWPALFGRDDVTGEVRKLLPAVPTLIAKMHTTLRLTEAPMIRPGKHCDHPYKCEFWGRCTAAKPPDWIFKIPHLSEKLFNELDGAGIESMRDIPPNTKLTPAQRRIVDAAVADREHISPALAAALTRFTPPVGYLDFETFNPAIPLYPNTGPYQQIPFQWSLHHDDGAGNIVHREFLSHGEIDPRREFAESLLEAVEQIEGPLAVYTSFEATILRNLVVIYSDNLAARLNEVIDRLVDLYGIVRDNVVHPNFYGKYSIKAVAVALAPHITYDDLDGVADGSEASAAFYWLVTDPLISAEDRARYRDALRAYCQRDTLAMVHVHRRLIAYTAAG